jgi:hypothetical protein
LWKAAFGTSVVPGSGSDGNGNGVIDAADYVIWRKNQGKSFPGIGSGADDGGGAAVAETLGDSRLAERLTIIAADSSTLTPTRQVGRTRHLERQGAAGEGLELESSQDRALMAWIAQSAIFSIVESAFGQSDTAHRAGFHEGHIESLELALVELGDRALANGLAQLRALS